MKPILNLTIIASFVLCLMALMTNSAFAQPEYSNGPGTGSGGNSIPWAYNNAGVHGQQLWPAGAFGTVPNGQYINRIYYAAYPGAVPPSIVTYSVLEVSMSQPNISSLNSSSYETGTTVVLNATNFSIYPLQGDWHSIDLTTPFQYNPNLPLLVEVKALQSSFSNFYNWVKPTASTGAWRNYATPYNATSPQGSGSHEMYFGFDLVNGLGQFPYCESFENGNGGWSEGGILSSWEHGEPDNTYISTAATGDYAWVTNLDGNYNNDELSYLQSPLINLESLVDPVMKVKTIRHLENGDDGVQVKISADSGSTFSVLGSSSSGNWYNSSSVAALSSQGNGNGWTGNLTTWTTMQHSLAAYNSDTAVFIRFVMAADGNTTQEGFGVDDILIAESNDIAALELFYPDSICGNSNSTVQAFICNISVEPKYGFSIDLDTNGTAVTYNYPDTLPICGCDTVDLLTFNTSMGGTWTLDVEVNNSGDVNAANDTLSGHMLMYATPGVIASGGGNACQGDVDTVTFTFTGISPWNLSYTNGTSPQNISNITSNPFQILVTTSGVYEPVYVADGSGCPADTSAITGTAVINFFPAPVIELGPDSQVCAGYVLNAGAGYVNYNWSTGQSGQTITANQTNIFSVTVTDTIGCQGSDVVDLEVFPKPVVTLTDTVLCEGSTFLFNAGGGAASYLWHDGSTGQLFLMDSIGTVSVTVTSFFGCSNSTSASITGIVPNPTPNITSTSSIAPVTLNAGPGYASYYWNNNATTQTISVSVAGTYTCTVTDMNGCEGEDSKKAKIWPTGIDNQMDDFGFAIFPNPASLDINIQLSEISKEITQVKILDMQGAIVQTERIKVGMTTANIKLKPTIANGQYIVRVVNEGGVRERSIIVSQ